MILGRHVYLHWKITETGGPIWACAYTTKNQMGRYVQTKLGTGKIATEVLLNHGVFVVIAPTVGRLLNRDVKVHHFYDIEEELITSDVTNIPGVDL